MKCSGREREPVRPGALSVTFYFVDLTNGGFHGRGRDLYMVYQREYKT